MRGESQRYVDLCVSLRLCDVEKDASGTARWKTETDEELLEVGGRWDRRRKRWAGPAEKVLIIRVHRGQAAAARYLAEWFRRRRLGPSGPQWDDFKRFWTLLLVGGRRGGKTWLAIVALVIMLAMMPRCRLWAVSPTLERAVKALLPRRWYTYRGGGSGKASQFRLPHGGRLLAVSGHKGSTLKAGGIDLALYNEGQNMSKKGWLQLRGAIADTGGMVIVAANPPDEPLGRWIEATYEESIAGKNLVKTFVITALDNPFVEHQALKDIAADANDDREYRREVLGEFVPIGDVVLHAWRDGENWKNPEPTWVDITAEFTRAQLGQAFGYVVLMDFQLTPAMVATVCKVFRDPADPTEEILCVVDEAVVEQADEHELLDKLESIDRWTPAGRVDDGYRGWRDEGDDKNAPVHCCVVMDASGFFQDGAHNKGKTSSLVLKARRWAHLYPPQKDSDRNPDRLERCKVHNSRLKAANGRRRLRVATHCVHTARAMRLWELRGGIPYSRSPFAHLCDTVGYGCYRFWGRPKQKPGSPEYKGDKRFDRRSQMKGVFRP